jgi:hypothetical protein
VITFMPARVARTRIAGLRACTLTQAHSDLSEVSSAIALLVSDKSELIQRFSATNLLPCAHRPTQG